jgi:hypothetical protein
LEPHLVRQLKPNQFILLTKKGGISYGVFPEVSWHKKEQEDILKVLGIKRDFTEPIQEGTFKGAFRAVGDKEHAEILRLYIEDNMSMGKIADKLERSPRTNQLHIQSHNKAVGRKGVCGACRRVKSEHYNILADRQF